MIFASYPKRLAFRHNDVVRVQAIAMALDHHPKRTFQRAGVTV
jgi:hypothetical protein